MGFMMHVERGTFEVTSLKILKRLEINHLDGTGWLILPTGLTLQTMQCHTLSCIFGHIPATGAYNRFIKNI